MQVRAQRDSHGQSLDSSAFVCYDIYAKLCQKEESV